MDNEIAGALQVLGTENALAVRETDPRLPQIASQLRMGPEALYRQIQRWIESPLEQQIYMALAHGGNVLRPAKFAEVLAAYRGSSPLTIEALQRKEVAKDIYCSEVDDLERFIETIQGLVEAASFAEFKCTFRSAIVIAQTYGENAEKVLDSIQGQVQKIAALMGESMRTRSDARIMNQAINFLARKIIPTCQSLGLPAPLSFMEFFEGGGYAAARRRCVPNGWKVGFATTRSNDRYDEESNA